MTPSGGEQYLQGLLPVYGKCRCKSHSLRPMPLKVYAGGAALVREALKAAKIDPSTLLATVKCKHCGGIALLMLKDLYLVA